MESYYKVQYGVNLRYPGLPCVIELKMGGNKNLYPPEMLVVDEGQKVPNNKLQGNEVIFTAFFSFSLFL